MSLDPIRFAGGLNLYEYCESDPVNLIDPDGERGRPVRRAQGNRYSEPRFGGPPYRPRPTPRLWDQFHRPPRLPIDARGSGVKVWRHNEDGPLTAADALKFRGATYLERMLGQDLILYRYWGGGAGPISHWWTPSCPRGPMQARYDLAIRPEWNNTMQNISRIRVPRGTTIYEGYVGAQGHLTGGGIQIYIPHVRPEWRIE
jgi:hypothetical protein